MATIDETFKAFKSNAASIKRFCETTSPNSCQKGKCRLSGGKGTCIVEEWGMTPPYKWEVPRHGLDKERNKTD